MCHESCFFSRLWVHINKRKETRMFIIDHPFEWHTFDLFVGMFQPPGRLLDWAIDDVCEFVRPCHFFWSAWKFPVALPRNFCFAGMPVLFFHKQHVQLFVLPRVMRLPSGCETDYKHCGPVQCKLWYLSPKWSQLLAAQTSNEFRRMVSERYHQCMNLKLGPHFLV